MNWKSFGKGIFGFAGAVSTILGIVGWKGNALTWLKWTELNPVVAGMLMGVGGFLLLLYVFQRILHYFQALSENEPSLGHRFLMWIHHSMMANEFYDARYSIGHLRQTLIEALDENKVNLSTLISIRDLADAMASNGIPTPVHHEGESDASFVRRWLLFLIDLRRLTDQKSIARYRQAIEVGKKHKDATDDEKKVESQVKGDS